HYNWFRFYDPGAGRYLRVDPIGFWGGDENLYVYVLNDPVNLVDPLGLAFSDILPGIKTAVVEGAKGGTYAVGEATKATADIAINGPPLAKTALGVAGLSITAPLAGAAGIAASPSVVSASYTVAPYSQIIVDAAYGYFTQGPFPQSLAGLGGWLARQLIDRLEGRPCK
ncbi:MAG: RHS repeat-associated core domain-containing protein, partial [Desulfosalsimonas sp.]